MIHIYSRNGIVDGKVEETKNKTFVTHWLCPKGFYQEGEYVWLGEFDNQKQAEQCLRDYILDREKRIKEAGQTIKIERDNFDKTCTIFKYIIIFVIFLTIFIPVLIILK
jgi:hypothetical protein